MRQWVDCKVFGLAERQTQCKSTEWTAGKSVLRKTRSRIVFVIALFVIAYGAVVGRMMHLTLTRAPEQQTLADASGDQPPLAANIRRADILDREGLLLATSIKTRSLYADPSKLFDPVEAARKINKTFPDLAYKDLLQKFQSKRRFVWLKRNLTPKQIYAANQMGIPGVDFLDETRRVYPQGAAAAHVLGYTDIDHKGLAGLERGVDKMLYNSDVPLQTTLDMRLQHILQREIKKSIADFNAIGGAGLIMDVQNGEIYALASLPDFNPHNPGSITDAERFNRITLGAYEMGSTFKTFTTAALLEKTNTPLHAQFDARFPLQRAGFRINDFHPEARYLSVPEVYIHSSNIGTALEAEKIGTNKLKDFFGDIGLLEKPKLEISEMAQPILPKPWRPISTLTAAYGHGIAVTPLQLATATASVINGGFKVKPTLIKHSAQEYQNMSHERVLSEKTSSTMRGLMRLVVSDGTASKANASGYRVGGKTGTAEKTLGRGYSRNAQIASFVGVFPMDAPRFVVLVMVDEPKGNKKSYGYATAGWVAAPYVGTIIKEIAPLVGVKPQFDERLVPFKSAVGLAPTTAQQAKHSMQQGGRLASY
jgi:cell division protein FtsI (penicillin-binding protein 3)